MAGRSARTAAAQRGEKWLALLREALLEAPAAAAVVGQPSLRAVLGTAARANEVSHLAARVLRVADLLEPDRARRVAVRERALSEFAVGRRAVPMLDVRCGVERLAGR